MLSNLKQEPNFLCDPSPRDLVLSLNYALENLATHSKAQMKMNFLRIEYAIKSRLARILEALTQRRSHCVGVEAKDVNFENISSQFLQMQKNQLIDLQKYFHRYCSTLPVFGFNSARYDMNFIKRYFLPLLVNERNIGPMI